MVVSRPELAVVFVPSIGLIGMAVAARKFRGSAAKRMRPALYMLAAIVLLVPAAYVSYQVAVSDVGFEQAGHQTILEVYGEARYERQFSDKDLSGDESPIIPQELYGRLPLPARIAMQTAGMLVLPFPWLIDRIPKALAFVDSLLFMYLLWRLWRARQVREVRYGLLVFAVALLGMGTTVSNFGNAFRMRMVLFPVLVVAVAFAVAGTRRKATLKRRRQLAVVTRGEIRVCGTQRTVRVLRARGVSRTIEAAAFFAQFSAVMLVAAFAAGRRRGGVLDRLARLQPRRAARARIFGPARPRPCRHRRRPWSCTRSQ